MKGVEVAPGMREGCWLSAGLLVMFLLAGGVAPGVALRWSSATPEYPAGPLGKLTCLWDCIRLTTGLWRPSPVTSRSASVGPLRLDERVTVGMSECVAVAENASGTVLTVWMMRDARDRQTYKIYGRVLNQEGRFLTPERRVNTGPSAGLLAHHSSLVGAPDGEFWCSWHASDNPGVLVRQGKGVFVRRFHADGSPDGPELLASAGSTGEMPSLGLVVNRPAVVWSVDGVVSARLLGPGRELGPIIRLSDKEMAEFPALASAAGRALVVWVDARTDDRPIRGRLLDLQLRPIGASFEIGPGPAHTKFFRIVSVAGSGDRFCVVWSVRGRGTYACWLTSDGAQLVPAAVVAPPRAEPAVLAGQAPGTVYISTGSEVLMADPGGIRATVTLLNPPLRPAQPFLASGELGLWQAWHDAVDFRPMPGLGDNTYAMLARLPYPR